MSPRFGQGFNSRTMGLTSDQLSRPPSPFKNILPDNNERKCDGAFGKELDSNRYLHKKFKKVATLEETTPVAAVAACGGDATDSLHDITSVATSPGGRYVCPYCALPCAKPSVLQKHIRAHTNERPYPCRPCGFAFKTKSNLYKHCRSRAHTLKMDVTDCSSNPSSGEEEDSGGSGSPNVDSEQPNKNKIYKPKFHTLQGQDVETGLASTTPKHFAHRINRFIYEGETVPEAPARFSCSSPLKEDSPEAASPFPSRLALALLRPPPSITLETTQPLNLSQKEERLQGNQSNIIQSSESSFIKGSLKEARAGLNGFKKTPVPGVECPDCGVTVDKLDVHLRIGCMARTQISDSSLSGPTEKSSLHFGPSDVTPILPRLSDVNRCSSGSPLHSRSLDVPQTCDRISQVPSILGRPIDIQPVLGGRVRTDVSLPITPRTVTSPALTKTFDVPPILGRSSLIEPQEKRRKLSPKSLTLSPPDLISSVDLSPHQKSIRLFGGQVKILDGPGGEVRTLRIDSGHESPTPISDSGEAKDRRILTISKTGHHSVGLTVIQSDMKEERKNNESLSSKIAIPILSNISLPTPTLDPLTTITAFNPLTLPPRSSESSMIVQPLTIVHGGKAIPHVPGMPGPNSLLDPSLIRKPSESVDSVLSKNDSISPPPPLQISMDDTLKSVTDTTLITASTSQQSTSSELSEKKFVRPTWLPLKAGTYVAKKPPSSLGPPPVALVSPETPRPRKSYGQLYLNGHAYTYLGLKCSSKMFFCTLNKPQPIYVPLTPEHVSLSMYSNWKVVSESALSPLGLSPACVMSSYDSRNRNSGFSQAWSTTRCQVLHSSYNSSQQPSSQPQTSQVKEMQLSSDEDSKRLKICNGGYESNEDYVYVRGRGRGKYVCEECGVRCSKPSMLKKHIRTTHSDLRPYSCKYCSFSFKTKGNLTKHMKSKAHYKQCVDLDISPVPMTVDSSNIDEESLARQNALCKELGADVEGSSEETEEDEEDDDLIESEDEEGKIEREAAVSLLSLSEVAQQSALQDYASLGLISSNSRPLSYPYTLFQAARPKSSTEECEESQEEEPLELTSTNDITTPIDLSNKTSHDTNMSKPVDPEMNLLSVLSTPVGAPSPVLSILSPVLPSPLGTPSVISDEGCALMTAYLKEKAARDTFIKQQQYNKHNSTLNMRLSLSESRNVLIENPPAGSVTNCHSPIDVDSSQPIDCLTIDSRHVDNISLGSNRMSDTFRSFENKQQMDSSAIVENLSVEARVTENPSERSPVESARRSTVVYTSESERVITSTSSTVKSAASDSEMMEVDDSTGEIRNEDCSNSVSVHSISDSHSSLSGSSISHSASQNTPIVNHSAKESALGILALTSSQAASKQPASILPPQSKLKAEFIPPASGPNYINVLDEGKSVCGICQKVFTKPSQLRLHVNIHYFERPFRCDSCGVSFRTKGHLQKHQRSISHLNKVNMNSTFGTATMSNPRPFKCTDCKIAFRIHGHLAKHLRSKMHIMRLECLGKLPFGMYAELERSGLNIHDIDTTDCHNSLESLQILAQKLHEKDPSKLGQWAAPVEGGNQATAAGEINTSAGETSSDEDEPLPAQAFPATQHCPR